MNSCGSGHFKRIRDCNKLNKPAALSLDCGDTVCNAALGFVARGKSCVSATDECAAFPIPTCHANASCGDPDFTKINSLTELCSCDFGFVGDGSVCRNTAAGAALLAEVRKLPGVANVSLVAAHLNNAADPDIADGAGVAALILAARNGHADIVSVLVTAGAEGHRDGTRLI